MRMKLVKAVAFAICLTMAAPVIAPSIGIETVEAATKLSCTKKTIYEGDTFKLKVTGTTKKVKWSSSDKKVATVNEYGNIKGISSGSATISAKYNKKTYKCKVTVKPKFNVDEAKSKIEFTPVETCENLYEITSTYDFPTLIVANYKIVDSEGVTVSKSTKYVIAVPWDKTYLRTPLLVNNNQTVQTTYDIDSQ